MTNLTSEQYRDVLKHIPGHTREIPTVQHLLRLAVQTFFKRFGGYPELAGVAPGKIGIFGDQTQFNDGMALETATPMATIVVGRRARGPRFAVATSADVGKPHKVIFSFSRNRPLGPGTPTWLNYVKGVIDNFEGPVPPFEAAIESSVPMGVGFGSTAALEVATYSFLEVLVGKKRDPIDKAKALQKAEREFAGKEVGLVDRINAIMAKDRHVTLIDCQYNEVLWVPFRNSKVTLVAVNSHLKDKLLGDEYLERTRYLDKACELLGVENLKCCSEEEVLTLENIVNEIIAEKEEEEKKREEEFEGEVPCEEETEPETWTKEEYDKMIKVVRFFITEMKRITSAVEAWQEGDLEAFGEKMNESNRALKEYFELSNPVLDFLVDTSLEVEGVLGSRMTGMGLGFGGGIVSLVNKDKVEEYCRYITEKYAEYESSLTEEMKEAQNTQKQRHHEVKKKVHSKHFNPAIASSEKIGQVQDYLEAGGVVKKAQRVSVDEKPCLEKKNIPCIVKVEKPPQGCKTWSQFQKQQQKQEFLRKLSQAVEEELMMQKEEKKERKSETLSSSTVSEASTIQVQSPSFYALSPFPGARMMFVTKTDMLRSLFANPLPHPKALVRTALKEFETTYGTKVEAIGLAPGSLTLFGQFMEFHLGYLIGMTLPMYTVTVGGRNDTVFFSFKTTSKEAEEPTEMKLPIPSVRELEVEPRSWVNLTTGVVAEFKGNVPGFNAVIHSSVPIQASLQSCAALQSSIYTFLENLTRECTTDPFEKIDRCSKSEYEFSPPPTELVSRCSTTKFLPVFLCNEGHLIFIDCKNYKISHYFFDNPAYAFLIAHCKKNTTNLNLEALELRLHQCKEAIETLEKKSLLYLELKHLRCLKKRDASEESIKRAKYVITEHQRTREALKAIKEEDYARVGLLMNQSHASLRDDYEVSSPEIESLIKLALSVEGVLGAKMVGAGLTATIIILLKLSDADKCIRYMRKNYKNKSDKPVFYITKPAGRAFAMHPTVDVPYIL